MIKLKNELGYKTSFVPYKENFVVVLDKDDELELDTLSAEEQLYYEEIADELAKKVYAKGAQEIAAALIAGEKVVLGENVSIANRLYADKPTTINLNGKTLSFTADVDTAGLIVKEGAEVTIQNGGIDAEPYAMDVNGGKLIVKSGNYYSNSASVIQVENGNCEIYGGTFRISESAATQWGTKYLLNVLDSKKGSAKITVYGGTFYGFNPAEDNKQEVVVAEGYKSVKSGDAYTVVKSVE